MPLQIHKLLADILCDMEICRLEGWSTKEYIEILKKEIDNIYNKFKEENATAVNLEAAAEIARQLRLRDMGGIITIDFIDMKKPTNRNLLYQTLVQLMKNDKAKHTILPVNKFGLIQITRQRVRQATIIDTSENCPSCNIVTGKRFPRHDIFGCVCS